MDATQVRILEKFGVSSVVLPYFGYAHQSFLLLSRLSRRSRAMFDDFYREIVNWLFEWNMWVSTTDHNTKILYLPSDLFKYSIDLNDKNILNEFVEFIKMRHQHIGHYFNEHYMHERLWITNFYIRPEFIQELVSYFDILNSIKLTDETDLTRTDFNCKDWSIINKFALQNFNFIVDDMHFILPQYLIDVGKLDESENSWKPFHKIFYLFLKKFSFDQSISILKDIGNIGMQINCICMGVSNIEELESLTNPEYFYKGLSKLDIWFEDTITLTDTFFDNINRIRLKEINFEFSYGITGSFDIIRILKNAPQNIKLGLIYGYSTNSCTLCFAHVPIKIVQSNCEDPLYAEFNQFTCFIEIDKFFENFWFSSVDSEMTQQNWETFIHVKMSKEYKFDCCNLFDESETFKKYKTRFPDHSPMSECEFIIPMKYLYFVYYGSSVYSLITHKYKLELMNQISKAKKIWFSISYYSE